MGLAKKVVLGTLVAGGAVLAFSGTRALRHVRNEVKEVRAWADDQVPMEKKFKMLRQEAEGLDREVDKVKTALAREIVETRELATTTQLLRAKVAADKKDLLARGKSISDSDKQVGTAGNTAAARTRLERDVRIVQNEQARLTNLETSLANREENRDILQQKLDAMVGQKDALLAEIGVVESDYKRLQLEQIKSKYQTDDTKLARIKERLREIKKEVDVRKVRHDLEPVGRETPAMTGTNRSVDEILKPLTEGGTPVKIGEAN